MGYFKSTKPPSASPWTSPPETPTLPISSLPAMASVYGNRYQPPFPPDIKRQDSGYESMRPGTSHSGSSSPQRRYSSSSSSRRSTARPSKRRSSKASSHQHRAEGTNPQSLYLSRQQPPQSMPFFHFPLFDSESPTSPHEQADAPEAPPIQLPPQTTHYWTSDRTRRLEYAAIDAASRGIKGWVMRNLVPECIIPKEKRHVGFDDDTGSVRRYRLDLEDGEDMTDMESKSGK